MDVPVTQNLAIVSTSHSQDGIDTSSSTKNEKNFSSHFNDTVDQQQKNKTTTTSNQLRANKESTNSPAATQPGTLKITPNSLTSKPLHLLNDPDHLAEIELETDELTTSLIPTATSILPSGNNVPIRNSSYAGFKEKIDVLEQKISFDPLKQASVKADGTTTFSDERIFTASKTAALLDDGLIPKTPEFLLAKEARSIQQPDIASSLLDQVKPVKGSANLEILSNSPVSSSLSQHVVADKSSITLDTPVNNPRWGQDFNQRIQWMSSQSINAANIRLNPQNMGPIEVKILMQNDQMNIAFTAQNGATRDAIEAALPRLRDMLSEQRLDLGNVDVSQHSFAEQDQQRPFKEDNESQELTPINESFAEEDLSLGENSSMAEMLHDGLFNKYA